MTQAVNLNAIPHHHPIRIMVISDAAPHRNGVGAYYADLLDDLADYVEETEIVSPQIIDDKWQGGWNLPLPGDKTQKLCFPNAFELQKRLRAFQPTVVIIPTPGMFGLLGAVLAKRLGIHVIVGFHTWFEKLTGLYWNRLQGGLTKAYFDVTHRALFRLADRVLANSQEMVDIARLLGAQNAGLMGTPLSQVLLNQPLTAIPKQLKSVLFVGRLAAEKNIMSILNAAAQHPDVCFTIAGDGPERANLQQSAASLTNVTFTGWVDRDAVTHMIDEHDALVLPSYVESFGTVAMEAMVRQRLVIVSKACGICDWSELSSGLRVIDQGESLTSVLTQVKELSEFEFYSQCSIARKAVLNHVTWNRDLWAGCLKPNLEAANLETSEESLRQRLVRLVGR